MVICLERGADLHMAQLMPLPLTVSCFSKVQIGFTFLVPAYPGSPGQRAVKRVCVCDDDDADAKMILTAPPPDNWKRPPGRPHIAWLNTVQSDLRAYNLTLNDAVDLAQNRLLRRRLMSTYGAIRTPSGAETVIGH